MKDFLFLRGFESKETIQINLNETDTGVITQHEYNRRRDQMAQQLYLERYYELQRRAEENRIEELNRI